VKSLPDPVLNRKSGNPESQSRVLNNADEVAAIICTRNGHSRGFLGFALQSIFDQTVAAAEIILVDDHSTDGTADEVRENYPHVTVIGNEGSGLAAARNTGIRAARSKWIAFIDDDDLWSANKFEVQLGHVAVSTEPDSTIFASRMALFGPAHKSPKLIYPMEQFARWPGCLLQSQVAPSGMIFSQSLYLKYGPFDESIGISAYDFVIRCLAAGIRVCFSNEILVYHRRGHTQMSSVDSLQSHIAMLDQNRVRYLKMMPAHIRSRFRTLLVLISLRSFILYYGPTAAIHYWASTPLRPVRFEWRALLYLILDTVSLKVPRVPQKVLQIEMLRVLLAGYNFSNSVQDSTDKARAD
jgi:glycosyltransferase involved in cell wall biosynthesis